MKIPTALRTILSAAALLIGFTPGVEGSLIVTSESQTSATYASGTTFEGLTSNSADPLAPFNVGQSVWFKGSQVGGNNSDLIGDARLIYRYKLDFGELTDINEIKIEGFAFNPSDNQLRLLNSDLSLHTSVATLGSNSYGTVTMNPVSAQGSVFYLEEYDTSTFARYRLNFVIDSSSASVVPEPTTLAIWSVLGGIGLAVGRRRKRKVT